MPTLSLSDAQQLAVINAARPLQLGERGGFLDALAALLAGRHDIGDGELHRILRDLQWRYLQPPATTPA
jgi:hypothetical protein